MIDKPTRKTWISRVGAILLGLMIVISLEFLLGFLPGIGSSPLFITLANHEGKTLRSVNRFYAQRFFLQYQGDLEASGKMAERFFVESGDDEPYRVVFLGASTIQGFPHPRRLAAASFLEVMLEDVWPNREVEVFNLGITSIASFAVAQVVEEALTLEPDVVVVYTGHNEFYGIYGAGDNETPRYNQFSYSLRQLHLGQIFEKGLGFFQQDKTASLELMQIMAKRGQIALDSPRRQAAESHLRKNLEFIRQACEQSKVPLLLCTLAANDAGFAPVGSTIPKLEGNSSKKWVDWVEAASRGLIRDYVAPGVAQKALEALEQAAAISAEHAWLWYLKGRALERLGNHTEAYDAYRKARDLDTMPWRAPTTHNAVIRLLAQQTGVALVDIEAAFKEAAPTQGVGWALMVDHIHFSVRGQALMARTILQSIRALSPSMPMAIERLGDNTLYRHMLGDLPVESAVVYRNMAAMLSVPPMDRYNHHNARYLKQLAMLEWQALNPYEQRGVEAWTKQGKKRPLALYVADYLFEAQGFPRAQAYYNASRREAPYSRQADLWAMVQWAWCIKEQGKSFSDTQREAMEAALERATFLTYDALIEPAFIDYIKGQLYHLNSEHQAALEHLERAFLNVEFRQKYAYSLFYALAAELIQTGRLEDAERYMKMLVERRGDEGKFNQLIEDFVEGKVPSLFP